MAKKPYPYQVEEKAGAFLDCHTIPDLKNLGFDPNHLQLLSLNPPYYSFEMRKRKGGSRTIEAPEYTLKDLQRQFNFFLQCVYYQWQSMASYGYIIGVKANKNKKNILENAKRHLGAKYMLNADFEDFFHQISAQRVLSLLRNKPFRFTKRAAHLLAKLFTYNNRLPMGAPTSPVLSNFAAIKLDKQLYQWALDNNITFTRFVDDMSFSSKQKPLTQNHLEAIKTICANNQFKLNPNKTKFFGEKDTKKVTGLVLNETVDIDKPFYTELNKDLKRLQHLAEANIIINKHREDEVFKKFKQEVNGHVNFIGTIEGYDSPVFYRYHKKMRQALCPEEEILSARWSNFNYF